MNTATEQKQMEHLKRWEKVAQDEGKLPHSDWEPQWFPSPVRLPERRVGKLRIEHKLHKAGDRLDLVSMREAILSGTKPLGIKLPDRLVVHRLIEDDQGVWMTDYPCELNQMAQGVYEAKPHGRVLVGGLGLGILPGMLRDNADRLGIDDITVVEKSTDVIKLCKQPGYKVVCDDIGRYLKRGPLYDTYMLDTWQGQNENAYWHEVFPLRRIIRQRTDATIWCWKEREMWGQVYRNLRLAPAGMQWKYPDLPTPMSHEDALFFLQEVGTPEWERRFANAVAKDRKAVKLAAQSGQ